MARSPESAALLNNRGQLLFQQGPLGLTQGSTPPPQHMQSQSAASTPAHHLPFQQLPQAAASMADLRPEALIQCQQIVKVFMLDNSSHGRMEAFLSQTPTHHYQHRPFGHHQLSQSAASTPVRSPDGYHGSAHQPPLPPPPPPYNHPHQYIPPDPRLSLHRTPSGSRSMV